MQYLTFLYGYYKEWRQNLQWSVSCCLALLLPLDDLQGEVHGMTGDNLMKTQIDTERTEKPSFAATVKDSGALNFTLCCEDVEGNDDEIRMEYNEPNVEVVDYTNKRCHRWTQTKVFVLPFVSNAKLGSLEDNQQRYK